MGRIYLTRNFVKFIRKSRIDERSLIEVIARAERGNIDADLGGGLVKLRLARLNEGKSGGYRSIVAFQMQERSVFLYGFAKNVRDNIDREEEDELRKYGQMLLALGIDEMDQMIGEGKLRELKRD